MQSSLKDNKHIEKIERLEAALKNKTELLVATLKDKE